MDRASPSITESLLDHGLDMEGSFRGRLTWETPAKIYNGVNLLETELGAYSYLAPRSELNYVSIGRYCSIGPFSRLFGSAHPTKWLSSHPFAHQNIFKSFVDYEPSLRFDGYSKATVVGHDVWMGADVTIIPGTKIGNGAVIGAGAVVAKDVPDYAVVVGNPGRVVKYRFDDALIERMQRVKWWRFDLPRLMTENPDLPFDRPEAMLDYIEEREDVLPKLTAPRKQLFYGPKALMVRTLPPASEAASDRSVPRP